MTELQRTIPQMRELARLSRQLGFLDDVEHWESEIARAERVEAGRG